MEIHRVRKSAQSEDAARSAPKGKSRKVEEEEAEGQHIFPEI